MPLPSRRKPFPCKSDGISGSSRLIFPKDEAVTSAGMPALTPLPLPQSKLNFPYSALGETISGCGRRVEHIAGCWETPGNKPCVLTKGLAYAKHFSYTGTASMLPCLYQDSIILGGDPPNQARQILDFSLEHSYRAQTAWFTLLGLPALWHTATPPAEPTNSVRNPCVNTKSPAQFPPQATLLNTILSPPPINPAQCQGQLGFNLHVQKIRPTNSKHCKLARPRRDSEVVRSPPYLTAFVKYSDF